MKSPLYRDGFHRANLSLGSRHAEAHFSVWLEPWDSGAHFYYRLLGRIVAIHITVAKEVR